VQPNFELIQTPCYLLEEEKLESNLKLLNRVQEQSGAKVLLALKGFAFWGAFDLCRQYLSGACASGLIEAKLAKYEFGKEVHTYSPAFKEEEFEEIATISDHIVFNSFAQWQKFKGKTKNASCGIRVNPEYSEIEVDLYNPCAPFSRMGVTRDNFKPELLDGIEGLHFHTHCEQNSDALKRGLVHFEQKFGEFIPQMKWINFGGGHHITRADYNIELLIDTIKEFKAKWGVDVYLEPGEAVGWQTGTLVASVLDIIQNKMQIAILDTSAEAHMPDTLAMPYRAEVRNASEPNIKKYTYRLAGNTCLAGDVMGDYSFDAPLQIGDKIIFEDQIHYTIVKNTTFNGIKLPSLAICKKDGTLKVIKEFGYEYYKNRLY
jgi:carboxynorspermidine decarboxylase